MKMAIIFGVFQMSFGICLTVPNYLHKKRKSGIFLDFLPQLLFLLSIFGYLVFMIVYKWVNPWVHNTPPSLLNTLIQMFLSPGKVEIPLFKNQVNFSQ